MLDARTRVHIVGVGGPGTSAIAVILHEMGHDVSGSDVRESPILDSLRARGVRINVPHDANAVHGCDIVTFSAAVRRTNVEIEVATKSNLAVLTRAQMLGAIASRAHTVAVAGTHGKTTTTALLTLMLRAGGRDPSYLIGAEVPQLTSSAHWGTGPFVVEADESDSSHRSIKPAATILTNVDVDHLDEHGSFEGIIESFDRYLGEIEGPKVVCFDDPTTARLALKHAATTYGLAQSLTASSPAVDVVARNLDFRDGRAHFEVLSPAGVHSVRLPLRGVHNVRNFLAAFTMAMCLEVDPAVAIESVGDFGGVRRRFEVRATHGGATFIDDYAHLPAEIAAVLAGVRAEHRDRRRVIAVFQPNRFNRMAVMSEAYRDAFIDADVVVITDIYASGTEPIAGVTGRLVVDAVRAAHPRIRLEWCEQRADLIDFVAREARDGDICISMGCGDIETFPDEVVARRRELSHGA
jgi:UDP-N-acetylmuramate--alanine ligase